MLAECGISTIRPRWAPPGPTFSGAGATGRCKTTGARIRKAAPGAGAGTNPASPALAAGQNPIGAAGQPGGASSLSNDAASAAASPEAVQSALVAKYRQTLPDTPEKLQASNTQVEAAMYALGTIYKEQLKEVPKGYETYATQVTRFPHGANAPDAYYLLYLHYKDLPDPAKTAEYAAALQREFPNSIYAKLIRDPQYREHEMALHNAVAARVDSAFTFYKNQEFKKARAVLARTQAKYPTSDLNDRVAYLNTLLTVRTQPPPTARLAVEAFYKKYPDSPLAPQAQALAGTYQKYEANQITGALASTDKPAISIFRPGEIDNRLRIFYGANESPYAAPTSAAPAPKAGSPAKVPASKAGSAVAGGGTLAAPASAPTTPSGKAPTPDCRPKLKRPQLRQKRVYQPRVIHCRRHQHRPKQQLRPRALTRQRYLHQRRRLRCRQCLPRPTRPS